MAGLWPARWQPRSTAWNAGQTGPLILTAALPATLQGAADHARRTLYPAGAARAPAHLTLFRHLPGPRQAELVHDIRALLAALPPPAMRVHPARLKNGILAAPVESPELDELRAHLADRWHGLLAPGDMAPPALHITLAGARGSQRGTAPPLPAGPWPSPGLLLWSAGGYGEACWTPLVASPFRR